MALTCGYITMFFSELYFFNEEPALQAIEFIAGREAGVFPWLLEMTFFYATFAYVLLTAIGHFRARSFWALFLACALFGWSVEGLLVPVMYSELPGSIAWPSLGWHAIVDALLGWYVVRRILRRNRLLHTALLACGLGVFWGAWVTWFWAEPEGYDMRVLPQHFAPYAMVCGSLCIAAHWVQERFGGSEFRPSRVEMGLLLVWCLFLFVAMSVPAVGVRSVVLPLLAAVVGFALRRNKNRETRPDVLSGLAGSVGWRQYAALLLMPLLAGPTYALFYTYDLRTPIMYVVVIPVTYAGWALLAMGFGANVLPRTSRGEKG